MIGFKAYAARATRLGLLLVMLAAQTGSSSGSVDSPTRRPYENLCTVKCLEQIGQHGQSPRAGGVRVVTYNIHSGLGPAFSLWKSRETVEGNLREIAGDIAGAAPSGQTIDVVALNEVDFGSRRSAWIDEAAFVADELKARTGELYEVVRGQTWERTTFGREVRFGNALLVRLPILFATSCVLSAGACNDAPRTDELPSLRPSGLAGLVSEERGVVKATVLAGGRPVDIVVTHLDAFSEELRESQATHVLERFIDPARSTILLGDLNAVAASLANERDSPPAERTLDILTSRSLADARTTYACLRGLRPVDGWATYPAASPVRPIDAVLASGDLLPADIAVIGRSASDHRGLAALLVPIER